MSKPSKPTGFMKHPLGRLSPTPEQLASYDKPRGEKLSNLSDERKRLLEDERSGYITKDELREELALLKTQEEADNETAESNS